MKLHKNTRLLPYLLEIHALFTQWVENEAFKTSKGVSPFNPLCGLTVLKPLQNPKFFSKNVLKKFSGSLKMRIFSISSKNGQKTAKNSHFYPQIRLFSGFLPDFRRSTA